MSWWHYLLLVNFYLVLFFGFYALLLRKETFFQLNRVYLVTTAILSFVIPVIQADWVRNLFITQQVQNTIYNTPINIYTYNFTYNISPADDQLTIGEVLGILYIVVASILVLKLMWELIVLKKEIEKPDPSVAYSFFKKISLGNNTDNHDVIARHEHVHARQWHTIDVLIIESIIIINWFNPVVYLYRFAIKYIHEFIADNLVLQAGTTDKADYAMLLLTQTFDVPSNNLVSNFYNHSLLKQRIIMLQKNKSKRIALAKYGLSAPLFVLMLILSSATVNNSKALKNITTKAEDVLLVPASSSVAMLTNGEKGDVVNLSDNIRSTNQNSYIDNNAILSLYAMQSAIRDTSKDDRIFTVLDVQPKFPGGVQNFLQYMSANIRYPAADRENNLQGKVVAQFVVEKDGSLTNIKIVRSPSAAMGEEAVRVLSNSPKWEPGMQGGKAVRAQFTIPVDFTLGDNGKGGNQVYTVLEVQPKFPGGTQSFMQYLAANIRYPAADRENNVTGRVVLQFVVEKDGSLTDIKAVRGPSQAMMNEAIRVLSSSPKWEPGIRNGQPVRSQFTVPVNFALGTDGTPEIMRDVAVNAFTSIRGQALRDPANAPVIIVDGVELTKDFNSVNQNDIESMTVLRSSTAVSLYGEKGKNGAILLTTKGKKAVETLPAKKQ